MNRPMTGIPHRGTAAKPRRPFRFLLLPATILFAALQIHLAPAPALPDPAPRPEARPPASSAPTTFAAQIADEIRARMPEWIAELKSPAGAAWAVVDDKSVLLEGVHGHTNGPGKPPVTTRTLFSIQSMSKSFAALGVLAAVRDGLLDLDAPITDYLPGFIVHSRFEEHPERKITLRRLLAHRAGFTHEAPVGGNFDSRPITFNEHILSISDSWLRYPVGYRYSYSNLGIDLAGFILEKKRGKPFEECIREYVFGPLGMKDSAYANETIHKIEDRAWGYAAPGYRVAGGIPVEIPIAPAGGVYTNLPDMARYLMFHVNEGRVDGRPLLSDDLIRAMHAAAFPETGQTHGYGLGIQVGHFGPEVSYFHGGGGYGFTSFMIMCPGLKLGVVILSNSPFGGNCGNRVASLIEDRLGQSLGPPGAAYENPSFEKTKPLAPGDPRVAALAGFYGSNVVVGPKDGVFGISIGKDFYPLTFYEDRGEAVGLFGKYSELRPKPALLGRPGSLAHLNRLSGNVSYYDFHKPPKETDAPGPGKAEWAPFLGTYRTLMWGRAFGSIVSVTVNDGRLSLNGMRCDEHEPGLFFTYDGEAVDFRGTIATFRNIPLIRTRR